MPSPGVTYNQMVVRIELSDDDIDRVSHALAAATRRDILRRTIEGELSVSALARDYDMSFAAVQKHVAVLEAAGLIIKRAEGRERLVRADPTMIARARVLLAQFEELWRSRIDRLDALLAEQGGTGTTTAPPTESDPSPTQGE
jgi:DNA-binding transcriptional ArsR family regulator